MPSARYSSGLTILPVWPICWLYGIQPESTAARVAPTAPPSAVGELPDELKPSGPPTPRPPATMIRASSIGRRGAASADAVDDPDRRQREVAGVAVAGAGSTRPGVSAGSAVTTFGRTVTMPATAREAATS